MKKTNSNYPVSSIFYQALFFIIAFTFACGKKPAPAQVSPGAFADRSEAETPLSIVVEKRVIRGYSEPNTPDDFNRVGYHRYYLKGQRNMDMPILIIVSGYVADTAWFDRMARDLVMRKNAEVWSINRRETFVEDRDGLNRDIDNFMKSEKSREAILRKMNTTANYLLCDEKFIKHWGLDVQIEDMKAVVDEASKHSGNLFLGGWSDGVEYVMMYSNYKFRGGFGSGGLKGMVFLDENPEWGGIQNDLKGNDKNIQRQEELMAGNHLYMKYHPSLAVHALALHLAAQKPDEKSPLASVFKLPAEIIEKGISNRALIGWLYDNGIDKYDNRRRGDFAYLIKSGNFRPGAQDDSAKGEGGMVMWESHKKSGDVTDISLFIKSYKAGGTMWEYFYPRKVLLDYFLLGRCDFHCPEFNVYNNKENRLPLFYILTGTNNAGQGVPSGLTWFMGKSGVTVDSVKFMRLYQYAHADIYFAEDAPEKLYGPLHKWMVDISGPPGLIK